MHLIFDLFDHIEIDLDACGSAEHLNLQDQSRFFRRLDDQSFGSHQRAGDNTAALADREIIVRHNRFAEVQ